MKSEVGWRQEAGTTHSANQVILFLILMVMMIVVLILFVVMMMTSCKLADLLGTPLNG